MPSNRLFLRNNESEVYMEFDYLLAAWWLTAFLVFFAPVALIERR